MAHAVEPAAESKILKDHPVLRFVSGKYEYVIRREGERVTYSVHDGKESFSAVLMWAFGNGSVGQTYEYQNGGTFYEARVSFYTALDGLDLTIGHKRLPVTNISEAAGRVVSQAEFLRCFGCHSTVLSEVAVIPGVRCGACHANARQHEQSMNNPAVAAITPQSLSEYNSKQMADFCGSCHRTWDEVVRSGSRDIYNVRFQPYRLMSSKCFNATDKRISCVACHDPHQPLVKDTEAYDRKCQACHASGHGSGSMKSCPVAKKDCVTCHMPKVNLPEAHFQFTDHRIRVARAGAPYPE